MKSKNKKNSFENPFLNLTWHDLQDWTGSTIFSRGKSYQHAGKVKDIGISEDNEIIAFVEGSTQYATKVYFKEGQLSSNCTCPYKSDCKHGVAVVIEYLESVKNKKYIPLVNAKDKRISLIKNNITQWPDDNEEDDDNETEEDANALQKGKFNPPDNIDKFLNDKTRNELIEIIKNIAASNFQIKNDLLFNFSMSSSSVEELVKTISKEIDNAASDSGWSNHWENTGYTPDYSRVQSGFQKLTDAGKYDEIVVLGKKLFSKGMEQIGQSDDDGETLCEISDTLDIVYNALTKCSMSNADKIEQAIDWEIQDEYSITDGIHIFWEEKFSKSDWNTVVDRLTLRLKDYKVKDKDSCFIRNYNRDKLTNHLLHALDCAGRVEEKIALCIQEAQITNNYIRLVKLLMENGKISEAEEWIRKGIKETYNSLPGIASGLREQLLEIYIQKREWIFCAAVKSDMFFEYPDLSRYKDLKEICKKIKLWKIIYPSIILFLNDGNRPKFGEKKWPLPDTGIEMPFRKQHLKPPYTIELIEIAIFENEIDEALRLFDEYYVKYQNQTNNIINWDNGITKKIADAVKDKYPERSIEIWKKIAEHHIRITSPKEYTVAINYLKKIMSVMKKIGQENDFKDYVVTLKEQNIRKIRFVEMLKVLNEKRIIDE